MFLNVITHYVGFLSFLQLNNFPNHEEWNCDNPLCRVSFISTNMKFREDGLTPYVITHYVGFLSFLPIDGGDRIICTCCVITHYVGFLSFLHKYSYGGYNGLKCDNPLCRVSFISTLTFHKHFKQGV